MENKKMTYVEAITIAMESADLTPEVVDRLNDLINSLSKKSVSKAQSEKAEANAKATEFLREAMEFGQVYSSDEICAMLQPLFPDAVVSTSKASTIMSPLVASGAVAKAKVKGKMTYTKADC